MRIIAGHYKGTRLHTPKSMRIRPTSDRVREFIFSCIQTNGSRVLDLFAGTGALGLEALSRGAVEVIFVDCSNDAVTLIRNNLSKIRTQTPVLHKRAEFFLKKIERPFDFIFCDPPYEYEGFDVIMHLIVTNKQLCDDGVLIYESSSRISPPIIDGLAVTRQKKMGDTLITFYKAYYENSHLSGNF